MLDEIVLIAKSKLNSTEVLIYKALIDSKISHDKFISINNVLKDCDDMKKETKTLRTQSVYLKFQSVYKTVFFEVQKKHKN